MVIGSEYILDNFSKRYYIDTFMETSATYMKRQKYYFWKYFSWKWTDLLLISAELNPPQRILSTFCGS